MGWTMNFVSNEGVDFHVSIKEFVDMIFVLET